MLKRENDFENDDKMDDMKSKYNIEELFSQIVLKEDDNKEEK